MGPVSPFQNPLLAHLSDPEVTALFAPDHTVRLYGQVEAALAEAVGAAGLVPQAEAAIAAAEARAFAPPASEFAAESARDGLALPAYAKALKAASSVPSAQHFKGTSQDIIDTAGALALQAANAIIAARLSALSVALAALAAEAGDAPLMGVTRMQHALPITVADRVAAWADPLARQSARFEGARAAVEVVTLGGPVGTRDALGAAAPAVATHMATALGLGAPARANHAGRDGVATYAAWLATTSHALGKVGQDVALMALQGTEEVALAAGGGSSAMAHKNNPIAAEALVTLSRYQVGLSAALGAGGIHEMERSGAAWTLEMMVLPQMVMASARGLSLGAAVVRSIRQIGRGEGAVTLQPR